MVCYEGVKANGQGARESTALGAYVGVWPAHKKGVKGLMGYLGLKVWAILDSAQHGMEAVKENTPGCAGFLLLA